MKKALYRDDQSLRLIAVSEPRRAKKESIAINELSDLEHGILANDSVAH